MFMPGTKRRDLPVPQRMRIWPTSSTSLTVPHVPASGAWGSSMTSSRTRVPAGQAHRRSSTCFCWETCPCAVLPCPPAFRKADQPSYAGTAPDARGTPARRTDPPFCGWAPLPAGSRRRGRRWKGKRHDWAKNKQASDHQGWHPCSKRPSRLPAGRQRRFSDGRSLDLPKFPIPPYAWPASPTGATALVVAGAMHPGDARGPQWASIPARPKCSGAKLPAGLSLF